jgi:hypothetical protein
MNGVRSRAVTATAHKLARIAYYLIRYRPRRGVGSAFTRAMAGSWPEPRRRQGRGARRHGRRRVRPLWEGGDANRSRVAGCPARSRGAERVAGRGNRDKPGCAGSRGR